jgi:hypothetical protein
MPKSMALSTIDIDIPDEVLGLLGKPPVLTEEECVAFEAILERFVQAVRPRDIVEWFFIWDLTVCRSAIQRLQHLKTQLIEQAHKHEVKVRGNRIVLSGVEEIRDVRETGAVELAAKIKKLKGGPDEIEAETKRLQAESSASVEAEVRKIHAEAGKSLKENDAASTVEETMPALFGRWIESHERADRSLIAEQKKFKESLRDIEDYRQGLGELLRQAEADIIDSECEEVAIPTEENRSQLEWSEVPVPSQTSG